MFQLLRFHSAVLGACFKKNIRETWRVSMKVFTTNAMPMSCCPLYGRKAIKTRNPVPTRNWNSRFQFPAPVYSSNSEYHRKRKRNSASRQTYWGPWLQEVVAETSPLMCADLTQELLSKNIHKTIFSLKSAKHKNYIQPRPEKQYFYKMCKLQSFKPGSFKVQTLENCAYYALFEQSEALP